MNPATDVTVCIPSHQPRLVAGFLDRAVASVTTQTSPVAAISIAVDYAREGAGPTRNRAMQASATEWLVLLDSDDELCPTFVERCAAHAALTEADVVFPWFDVVGGTDPFPQFFGRQFDPNNPHQFPITTLLRRSVAEAVGWMPPVKLFPGRAAQEDFAFWVAVGQSGAKIEHLSERLWCWYHNSANTGGRQDRW